MYICLIYSRYPFSCGRALIVCYFLQEFFHSKRKYSVCILKCTYFVFTLLGSIGQTYQTRSRLTAFIILKLWLMRFFRNTDQQRSWQILHWHPNCVDVRTTWSNNLSFTVPFLHRFRHSPLHGIEYTDLLIDSFWFI